MTMHINLSKEMEAYIRSKVEGGFYGNATEVIRDAVRRMYEDEAQFKAFQEAVDEGEEELERGEGIRWTKDTMKRIVADVIKKAEIEPQSDQKRAHG